MVDGFIGQFGHYHGKRKIYRPNGQQSAWLGDINYYGDYYSVHRQLDTFQEESQEK